MPVVSISVVFKFDEVFVECNVRAPKFRDARDKDQTKRDWLKNLL